MTRTATPTCQAGLGWGHHRDLGRDQGLAAGLAAVLGGLDPAASAPDRVAVLPAADLPDGVSLLRHDLAAREGLAVVRFPPGPPPGAGLTGWRAAALAAVRLGLLDRLLELAVERLAGRRFGGVSLIERQLVAGAVADVVTGMELAAATRVGDDAPPEVAVALHERLTEIGWTVTRLFGAEGYLADHPARSLYVSTLVADVWVARAHAWDGDP